MIRTIIPVSGKITIPLSYNLFRERLCHLPDHVYVTTVRQRNIRTALF